jgi:hypothetical protein
MNPSRAHYHQTCLIIGYLINYLGYVKDSNPNVHVIVFKAAIRANGETKDEKIVNLFSFTLKDIMFNWCNNYMGDYPNCTFA